MITNTITKDVVQCMKSVPNWREAIKIASKPMLEQGKITEGYVEAMIQSVDEFGPYIIIAPMIAMPHARPEAGSLEIGLSVLKLEEPVSFTNNDENLASLIIVLSCKEDGKHIEVLGQLAEVLSDEDNYNKALKAQNVKDILEVFDK
ncbi:MAG: PTS sugar transporter subunit IIA [Vallitalea sp.]|nr:PTS sugar transporter subunit IIA [Vallitalea sp.]